jgi:hypothetical protein
MNEQQDFSMDVVSKGRIGDVIYREGAHVLTCWWEFTATGVSVWVPTPSEWPEWATGRRNEILGRIAGELRRQQAPEAEPFIDDRGIHLRL